VPVLERYGVPFDILADGDNALIFLEVSDYPVVSARFEADVLGDSGFEMTLERPVRLLEEIRFGRSAPVNLGGDQGWLMVRELVNVLSGAFSSHVHLRQPAFMPEWLTGVAQCELSLALGVPMLQAWVLQVLDTVDYRGNVRCGHYRDYLTQGAWFARRDQSRDVTEVARDSFNRAFGVTPEQQVLFEETCGLHVRKQWATTFATVPQFSDANNCPPGVGDTFIANNS
jgi:hypothetical protein